jgi:mannose-6-phosphate isomerase-like protein (cupin superfamily)
MLSAYRLPVSLDPAPLRTEVLETSSRARWIDHWADGLAAPGTWCVLPLILGAGDVDEITATRLGTGDPPRPSSILADMPSVRGVIQTFRTEILRARLMRLAAGAVIREHRDFAYFGSQRWSFERGRIRVHIPIVTDGQVIWRLDGQNIAMAAGEAWYVNVCRPHSVENRGSTDRINLVLELEVNDWLRELFPPESSIERLRGHALRLVEPYVWAVARSLKRTAGSSERKSDA